MVSFGFIRQSANESKSTILKYSDWHASVYESDGVLQIMCGSKSIQLDYSPLSICSNSDYIFFLKCDGNIAMLTKSSLDLCNNLKLPSSIRLAVNDEELFGITEDNFLFCVQTNHLLQTGKAPVISYPMPVKVKSVSCGPGFALFLTPSGSVFSKGINSRGQLGQGDLEARDAPTLIEALQSVTILSIACGFWHSVCLSDTGDVYTWGSNEYGQLGIPSLNLERSRHFNDPLFSSNICTNVSALPSLVDIPGDLAVESIACGSRHTACITDSQEVFTFGWNGCGQLGFEPPTRNESDAIGSCPHLTASDKPIKIDSDFLCQKNVKLCCGQWSTFLYAELPV